MAITTIRLEDNDLDDVKLVAKDMGVDQSTVLKRALRKGVGELRIELALEKYARHKISFSDAAKFANISQWRLLDEMKSRGAFFQTDEENLEESLKELL